MTERRILVVDDNRDAAESMATMLSLLGHATATVFDGPAALSEAERFRPHLVLLDIALPGFDGFEVARRLRASDLTASARLVATSGFGRDEDRRRAQVAGFDAYLTKPVDPVALLRLIESVAVPPEAGPVPAAGGSIDQEAEVESCAVPKGGHAAG